MDEQDYRIHLAVAEFDPKTEPQPVQPGGDSYYIVQFVKPLTREEQQHLRDAHGLRLTEYVPNLAYLERLSPERLEGLTRDELYRAHVPYAAEYRVSPSIGEEAGDAEGLRLRMVLFPEAENLDGAAFRAIVLAISSVWVTHFRVEGDDTGEDMSEDERAETAARLMVLDDTGLGGQMQLMFSLPSAESLLGIASLEGVRWIEEARPVNRDAGDAAVAAIEGIPAGLIQSGTPGDTPVWKQGITGRGQVIGVTDGAPDVEHCQIIDPANPVGPSHRKVHGMRHRVTLDRRGKPRLSDHGMAVVSIAAGRNIQIGTPEKDTNKGVAYEARLSLDNDADVVNEKTMMAVLDNQRGDGACTHSNSWHIKDPSYNQLDYAVDRFVWLNEEHLVCGSSGNKHEKPGPPATAKNAISVSASGNAGYEMELADGVSAHPGGGRRKPDICAPGCQITAANVTPGKCSALPKSCATSWAVPVIAGAAALVRQYYVEGWYPTGTKVKADEREFVSAALVKATLLNSTVDMTGVSGYPSVEEGWGLVRLANSLFFAGGQRKLFIDDVPNASGLHKGESKEYEVSIQDSGQPLKITLCWSDPPPGVFGGGLVLVNDLDLEVTAPDGLIYSGNNIDLVTGFSKTGTFSDKQHNVEMVIVRETSGVWRIKVSSAATNVGAHGQGFALVVTASISGHS